MSTPTILFASNRLELEASGKLNLALTEQCAVSAGDVKERIRSHPVEGQRRARLVIDSRVDVRDLRAVEHVEALSQQFELDTLSQTESSRNPSVEVPNVRLFEEVARHHRKARRAP